MILLTPRKSINDTLATKHVNSPISGCSQDPVGLTDVWLLSTSVRLLLARGKGPKLVREPAGPKRRDG